MRYNEYSYRHGKELFQTLQPATFKEVDSILADLDPFPHGAKKFATPTEYMAKAFIKCGWTSEKEFDFKTEKRDFLDFYKERIGIEMEFSRFEMFFRDFFRFMLLYSRKEIGVGVILTLDDMAYKRGEGEAKSYKSARASFQKLVSFLEGEYSSIINVPLWCIGIE